MKKLILLGAAIGLFACSTPKETGFIVNVTLNGDSTLIQSDSLVLTNMLEDENAVSQTIAINGGKGTFKGNLSTPDNFYIKFKDAKGVIGRLFLENDKFDMSINLSNPRESAVVGGKTQRIIDSLNTITEDLFKANKVDSLMKLYYSTDSKETKDSIEKLYDSLSTIAKAANENYIIGNPTSLFALENFVNEVDNMELASAEAKLSAFVADSVNYKNNYKVKKVAGIIESLKALQVGMVAPDFTQNDVDGNPVKLSDIYKANKVTMVDFWASWCGPCRAFNPTLTKIYNKYNKKGFQIIGVSFDEKEDAWKKGIKDDKLTWINVSDLKGWKNEVGKPYMVHFIPQNIILDSEGKIIKRRASEEELVQILEERLK